MTEPLGRAARTCLVFASTLLVGCAPYFHNEALEKRTAAIKEQNDKTVGNEDAFFAAEKAYEVEHQKKLNDLFQAFHASRRNRLFASLVRPVLAVETEPRTGNAVKPRVMLASIERRLGSIIGGCTDNCDASYTRTELRRLSLMRRSRQARELVLRISQDSYTANLQGFLGACQTYNARIQVEAGGSRPAVAGAGPASPVDCRAIAAAGPGAAAGLPDGTPDSPRQLHADLVAARADLTKARDTVRNLGTDFGDGSLMKAAYDDLDSVREQRVEAVERGIAIEQAIDQIETIDASTPSSRIAAIIKEIKGELADAPSMAKVAGSKKLGRILDDVLSIELAASDTKANPPPAETVAQAGTEPTDSPAEKAKFTKRAEAVLAVVANSGDLLQSFGVLGPRARVSTLLLATAAQRHDLEMARMHMSYLDRVIFLKEKRIEALQNELTYLAEARLAASSSTSDDQRGIASLQGKDRDNTVKGLEFYSISWSDGRIPYEMLEQRQWQLDRAYHIEVSERTTANIKGLIQPAVNELAAAGAAGLRSETIAQLLGHFSIAGAVLAR
jgi:hypothetical protein